MIKWAIFLFYLRNNHLIEFPCSVIFNYIYGFGLLAGIIQILTYKTHYERHYLFTNLKAMMSLNKYTSKFALHSTHQCENQET